MRQLDANMLVEDRERETKIARHGRLKMDIGEDVGGSWACRQERRGWGAGACVDISLANPARSGQELTEGVRFGFRHSRPLLCNKGSELGKDLLGLCK